jgi:hypothetical protein
LILKFNQYSIPVKLVDMGDEETFGQFFFFPYPEIQISKKLKREVETSTILHEVLELVSELYGLSLDESQIRVLEVALMGVFTQNPWLVSRLGERPQEPVSGLFDWPPSQTLPDSPEAL